jgi:hypothetical protein
MANCWRFADNCRLRALDSDTKSYRSIESASDAKIGHGSQSARLAESFVSGMPLTKGYKETGARRGILLLHRRITGDLPQNR